MLQTKYSINRLGVFGSYIRGEQEQDSDIDILIDYKAAPTIITLIELERHLSKLIGIKVDLVTINGLKPPLKKKIMEEVVYI